MSDVPPVGPNPETPPPPPPDFGSPPPYVPVDATRDGDHLRVLSICWYVVAGLQCLGVCGGLVYLGLAILAGAGGMAAGHDNQAPAGAMAAFFACFGVFIMVICGVLAYLSYRVGRNLAARRSHTFCFVMAVISCLSVPLGTILGIFTLVVLSRPSVKASFMAAGG